MRSCRARIVALLILLSAIETASGQFVSGAIHGRITDQSGAILPKVEVAVTSNLTSLVQTLWTGLDGRFAAQNLPPGRYEVVVSLQGFRNVLCQAVVQAGTITEMDLVMQLGDDNQSITVSAASPRMHYDAFAISGTITRQEIENTPLNGRNFLELAKLEPGALPPSRGSNGRTFVPVLASPAGGNNGRGTAVSVDGASIVQIGNGGAAMGFSQEIVEEFQTSTANYDISTNITASGALNIVTRSGSNRWHVSGFYFFRDHHLSAYPALTRDVMNPDPFFQRQQFGASAGGFVRKNRAFIFGSIEQNNQRGVVSTDLITPEFSHWSRITPSPLNVRDVSLRTDLIVDHKDSIFVRYSHEGGFSFAPTTVNGLNQLAYPSAWTRQPEWADQSVLGWSSEFAESWASDLRLSYFFVSSAEQAPSESDCAGCLGIGAPAINVPDLYLGTSTTTSVLGRRFELNESLAWQRRSHSVRLGGDWQTTRGGRTDLADQPVTMTLFSPKQVNQFNALQPVANRIPLPMEFNTLSDILSLPLESFTVGIGDPHVPQRNAGNARLETLLHLYAQDRWLVHPSVTLSYGVAWSFETPLNYDLYKPAYLRSVADDADINQTRRNLTDFSPSVGFAWSPGSNRRTVVRGGAGIYYDFQTSYNIADQERVSLGSSGVGRVTYAGGGIGNPLTDVPGVPQGTLLSFFRPTQFSGSSLLEALPAIRDSLARQRVRLSDTGPSATNIEVDKQGSFVGRNLANASSLNFTLGAQRELQRGFVLAADIVYQRFANFSGSYAGVQDINHFYAARGPALPVCTAQQRSDPKALCSLGPIMEARALGRGDFKGLLFRVERRYSSGWELLASYSYARANGNSFVAGYNNDDPLANYGPLNSDFRHILAVSGGLQLPWRLGSGIFLNYVSRPPVSVVVGGIDFNGDGTTGDLLPGTRVNQFNRGSGKHELQELVNTYNRTYAGQRDAHGSLLQLIVLPSQYELGDPLLTQDIRLSRDVRVTTTTQLTLIGEVFNVCNIANLSGRGNNVLAAGFGQPKNRVSQVFGSGGPRAIEIGARLRF